MKVNPLSQSVEYNLPHNKGITPRSSNKFEESIFSAFEKLENSLSTQHSWSPQELIRVQMQAHRLQLAVECTTKLADGLSSTVRKLQAPQG